MLVLWPGTPGQAEPVQGGIPASVTIETDDIRKTYEELKSRGSKFETDVLELSLGRYVAQFLDPDGNRLQIERPLATRPSRSAPGLASPCMQRTTLTLGHLPRGSLPAPPLSPSGEQREQTVDRVSVLVHLNRMPQQRRVVQRDLDQPLAQIQELGHPGGLWALARRRGRRRCRRCGRCCCHRHPGVEARLELRDEASWARSARGRSGPPANRRGVIEHAGLLRQTAISSNSTYSLGGEEEGGSDRLDPLVDHLEDVVDDVAEWSERNDDRSLAQPFFKHEIDALHLHIARAVSR